MRRRGARALCSIPLLIGLSWWSARAVADWRLTTRLAWATTEISAGRFDEARRWPRQALPSYRRSDPEAADLRGVCEHVAGRYEAALAVLVWRSPDSPPAPPPRRSRAETLVTNLGRFADAEVVLEAAVGKPGSSRLEIRHSLGQLYFWESRPSADRRLIVEGRREWPNPAAELPRPLADRRRDRDHRRRPRRCPGSRAARPVDHRVWLAQVGLNILEGHFDKAKVRLESCTLSRPHDPAVWEAWLRLAKRNPATLPAPAVLGPSAARRPE